MCGANGKVCEDGYFCFNATCLRHCCDDADCGPQGYCELGLGLSGAPVGVCSR